MRVRRTPNPPRRGAQMVETAIVLPVVMMLTLGTFSTAMGVYYYQRVATLAREGARYASVHGTSGATAEEIYNKAILPMAVGLNTTYLRYQIQWGTKVSGSWVWTSWDSSSKLPISPIPTGGSQYNSVSVIITYPSPDLYMTGPLNLTSTSVMPMSY